MLDSPSRNSVDNETRRTEKECHGKGERAKAILVNTSITQLNEPKRLEQIERSTGKDWSTSSCWSTWTRQGVLLFCLSSAERQSKTPACSPSNSRVKPWKELWLDQHSCQRNQHLLKWIWKNNTSTSCRTIISASFLSSSASSASVSILWSLLLSNECVISPRGRQARFIELVSSDRKSEHEKRIRTQVEKNDER